MMEVIFAAGIPIYLYPDMTVKNTSMSHLIIEGNQNIRTVQQEFNRLFPFLKIEFFTEPHPAGKLTVKSKMINSNERIADVQRKQGSGLIDVSGTSTVSKLENSFEEQFGLYVQVFRKSGSIWLETSATDSWTLDQQNEEGRSLHQHFKIDIDKEEPNDRDVYR